MRVQLLSWFLSYLCLFDKLLPCMGFDSSHTYFHYVEKIMLVCLEYYGQWHASGAHKRKVAEPFNIFQHGFSSFLDCQEELVYSHLGVILVESREKPGFQFNSRIDRAIGKTPEPIEGYSLKGADE